MPSEARIKKSVSDGSWGPLKDQFAVTHARRALRTTEQPEDDIFRRTNVQRQAPPEDGS